MWIDKQTGKEVDVRDCLYDYYEDYFNVDTLENYIDECYEPVEVLGFTFSAGHVLSNCLSNTDWYYLKQDFVDSSVEDDYYDIEHIGWHEGESPNMAIRATIPDSIVWKEDKDE